MDSKKNRLRCIVIDDEPLARECISNYVNEVNFLELAGDGSSVMDLQQYLRSDAPDLIFLDIQMPRINGIEFIRSTQNLPMIILTTAFPQYAVDGFQLDVMDYLLKPITFERFYVAVSKALDYDWLVKRSSERVAADKDYFFIKCGHKYERIHFDSILYIEAMQNYVTLYTQSGKYTTLLNMKGVEQYLESHPFIRVHKSYIVSIGKIEAIENNEIRIASARIPISRQYRDVVLEKVVSDNLWRR